MNKSLKFLAIGLALAVLVVSQVGVDRSAVAHTATPHDIDLVDLDQDDVSFTDSHGQEKGYYKHGDTAHFVLRDSDLAQDTADFSGTVTWVLGHKEEIKGRTKLNLVTGAIGESEPYGTRIEDGTVTAFINVDNPTGYGPPNSSTTVTFVGTGMPKGPNAYARGFYATTTDKWKDSPGPKDADGKPTQLARLVEDAMLSPLVGDPSVRVGTMTIVDTDGLPDVNGTATTVFSGDELILRRDLDKGTVTLLEGVKAPTTGTDGKFKPGENIFTVLRAEFNYQIVDVFNANQNDGTGAEDNENRALVTTSSFPSGKWVTISEIEGRTDLDVGNSGEVSTAVNAAPTSGYYYGSVIVVGDSATGRDDGNIWARDGDTITVEFFGSDHSDVLGSAEATIDAVSPSISGIAPSGGSVLNDTPVISFDISDMGSGFSTSDFEQHVDLFLLDKPDVETDVGCQVEDSRLSATRLSSDEISVQFRSRDEWGDDEYVTCVNDGGGRFQAKTNILGANSHGDAFGIRVVATDLAGNEKTSTVKVTIDNENPRLLTASSSTGKAWDADEGTEVDAQNSIKLAFNESLNGDTVDIDDFEVENPDAAIVAVTLGGANEEDDENKQFKNEFVYLTLSENLGSSDEPRVEIIGSVSDLAGNEQRKGIITRLTDRIGPGVTVDSFSGQLLAEKGEATVSFGADENMSQGSVEMAETCTCLAIAGGGAAKADPDVTVTAVTLPTPKTATYTFKQGTFKATGIYGALVQATDSSANVDQIGEKKITEAVTAVVAEDGAAPTAIQVEVEGKTATSTVYVAIVKLSKWPLADIPFDGSLEDSVTIKGAQQTEVTNVNWRDGEVTLEIVYKGEVPAKANYAITDGMELEATYHYVVAEQVIEVDVDAPTVGAVTPSGDTQNGNPFITIMFDEDEYAGDTHKTVVVKSATLTDEDDNETVLVDAGNDVNLLSTSDNILFSYLPESALDVGEYTISVVAEDDAGNVMEASEHKFKVVARPPVTIPLNLGWNLISLPGAAADSSIGAVIDVEQVSQVLTYDPTVEGGWLAAIRVNGGWEGGLTDIDPSKAYLVYTTSVDDLKVDIPGFAQGAQDFPPTIQVYTGWNMIPAASLDPEFEVPVDTYLKSIKWTIGYYYDTAGGIVRVTLGEGEEKVTTGRGFLIYVEEDGVLVP